MLLSFPSPLLFPKPDDPLFEDVSPPYCLFPYVPPFIPLCCSLLLNPPFEPLCSCNEDAMISDPGGFKTPHLKQFVLLEKTNPQPFGHIQSPTLALGENCPLGEDECIPNGC